MDKFLIHRLVGKFFKHAADDRFHRIKYVLLFNKAHLKVELIELARAAISAAVLITETGGDLEIAIKTGNHHQLLELLGGLRQGIELARVYPGRNQEITRALG